MRLIGLIISFICVCALSGGYLLGKSIARDITYSTASAPPGITLALAPLSLGNPSAANGPKTSLPLVPNAAKPSFENQTRLVEHKFTVREGDTLATVLNRAGISRKQTHAVVEAFSKKFNPRLIRAGQKLWVRYETTINDIVSNNTDSGIFLGFRYEPRLDQEILVLRGKVNSFEVTVVDQKVTRHLSRSEGIIESSLYMAGKKANLPPSTLAKLIRIFSWDIDFQRDIRKGDKFETMFNIAINDDGKTVSSDEILFAALTLQGKRRTIYRFSENQKNFEYFDENGNSAQKALMRTPIDGARLSSGFGRRRHPILGYTKIHRGVDFAAPRGTPIYAAGNGIVELATRKGGYGKYIRIRHNGEFKTAYAHLSRFGRGIRKGKRVQQGQTIGFVGSTGRSTGNHLHYEIIRNGRRLNPIRVKMPSGRKLVGASLTRFHVLRKELDSRFASMQPRRTTQMSSAD